MDSSSQTKPPQSPVVKNSKEKANTPSLELKSVAEGKKTAHVVIEKESQKKKNKNFEYQENKSLSELNRTRDLLLLTRESLFARERVKRDLDVYADDKTEEITLDDGGSEDLGSVEVFWEEKTPLDFSDEDL